jgi:hypothetical protein
MKKLAIALTACIGVIPLASHAVECTVPGSTIAWATDQCLLETGESDSRSAAVRTCLSKMSTIRQPCEWNIVYKASYCKILIAKSKFVGSNDQCVNDPGTIGPTVRSLIQVHASET